MFEIVLGIRKSTWSAMQLLLLLNGGMADDQTECVLANVTDLVWASKTTHNGYSGQWSVSHAARLTARSKPLQVCYAASGPRGIRGGGGVRMTTQILVYGLHRSGSGYPSIYLTFYLSITKLFCSGWGTWESCHWLWVDAGSYQCTSIFSKMDSTKAVNGRKNDDKKFHTIVFSPFVIKMMIPKPATFCVCILLAYSFRYKLEPYLHKTTNKTFLHLSRYSVNGLWFIAYLVCRWMTFWGKMIKYGIIWSIHNIYWKATKNINCHSSDSQNGT